MMQKRSAQRLYPADHLAALVVDTAPRTDKAVLFEDALGGAIVGRCLCRQRLNLGHAALVEPGFQI
jgi:hypothetical protein